jgi:hypothetical protein
MPNGSGYGTPVHDHESPERRCSGSSYQKGILEHAPQLAWKSEVPLSSVLESGRLLCGEALPQSSPGVPGVDTGIGHDQRG